MEALSDYFRLKEFDRIEAENKCLATLKKVIDVCLKKGFHFSVNPNTHGITVSTDEYKTSFDSYFKGQLIDYSDGNTYMTVSQLLEKLNKIKNFNTINQK